MKNENLHQNDISPGDVFKISSNYSVYVMRKPEPIAGLSDDDEGLTALRRERGRAWNVACDDVNVNGKSQPPLRQFGIDDIKRLAQRLGGSAVHTHWLED